MSRLPVRPHSIARNSTVNRTGAPAPSILLQQEQRQFQRQQQQIQQQQQLSPENQVLPDYVLEAHPTSELIKFLNELGLPTQDYYLQRPHPLLVQEMFEFLLSVLVPDSFSQDQQVQSTVQQQVSELYETAADFTKVSSVYNEMKEFLSQLRFTDFSLSDILQPNASRLRIILSVIYNYALHEVDAREYFDSIDYAAVEDTVNVQELKTENYELKQDVLERQEQSVQLKESIEQLQEESNEWEAQIKRAQNDTATLVNELNQRKQERANLKEDMQLSHYHVLEIAKQLKDLTNIINMDVDQLGATNDRLEESIREQRQNLHKLQQQADALDREYTLKKSLFNNLDNDKEAFNKYKRIFNELERAKKSHQTLLNELNNLDTNYKTLLQACNGAQRQFAAKELQIKKSDEQQEKKRESMLSYYADIEKRRLEADEYVKKGQQEIQIIVTEINTVFKEVQVKENEFDEFVQSRLLLAKNLQQRTYESAAKSKKLLAK